MARLSESSSRNQWGRPKRPGQLELCSKVNGERPQFHGRERFQRSLNGYANPGRERNFTVSPRDLEGEVLQRSRDFEREVVRRVAENDGKIMTPELP